jgi:hypothetical protein
MGHDESPSKLTFAHHEQRTKSFDLTTGIAGGKPIVNGGFTYAKVDGGMIKVAEDVVRAGQKSWCLSQLYCIGYQYCWQNIHCQWRIRDACMI